MPVTVLLDLDGVLMDHVTASSEAVHVWLGERATPDAIEAWFAATDRHLAEWRAGRSGWEQQRRDRMREFLPVLGEVPGTDAELDAEFASGYLAAYEQAWRGFDDAAPAVEALHAAGHPTAVLTNGSERQQLAKLRTVGLLDRIGPVFTAEALGLRKPDPRAFRTVCERLGTAPADVLYVGDEHEVDVLGARSAGMRAVLLDRSATAPPGETEVVTSLAELPAFVRRAEAAPGRLGG